MKYNKMNKSELINELEKRDLELESKQHLVTAVGSKDSDIDGLKDEIKNLKEIHKEDLKNIVDGLKQEHSNIIKQKDEAHENAIKNINDVNKLVINDLNLKLEERSEILAKFVDMYANTLKMQQSSLDAHLEIYDNLMKQLKELKQLKQ